MKTNIHIYKFKIFILSRSILLGIKNVSDKRCTGNQSTDFMFNTFSENRAVYEITWRNKVETDATLNSIHHAHCMLNTQGSKQTLTVCNTYCPFYCNNACQSASQWYVISGWRGDGGGDFERERSVFIFSIILSAIFHFLRKPKPHVIRHVCWS
jgi:hypothetical protein